MSTTAIPQTVRPKKRRFWLWGFLSFLLLVIVWWFYPVNSHYRIRDLAAKLDKTEPGWRLDEIHQAKPVPPVEQNAFLFLKPLEVELPTGLSSIKYKLQNTLYPTKVNPEEIEDISQNENLASEYAELLQQTTKLRQQLHQLTAYPQAYFQEVSWKDLAFNNIPSTSPRLDEWYSLIVLHAEEGLRGKSASTVELRLKLLFHHLVLHQLPNNDYTSAAAKDFSTAATIFEKAIAQFPLSDATLTEIDRLLASLDWQAVQQRSWRIKRATIFERCTSILENWDQMVAVSRLSKLDRFFQNLARDDLIEGLTCLAEYYDSCLNQSSLASHEAYTNDLLAKLKPYSESPSDIMLYQLWKRIKYKGRMGAYHGIMLHEDERNTYLAAMAQTNLLRTAIAQERFRRKTGCWATSWNELVPDYLSRQLDNPFHPGTPVRWALIFQGLRLIAQKDGPPESSQKVIVHILQRVPATSK